MREQVKGRIRTDDAFGNALLSEAIEVLLADDMATAKSVLFDYIDATIGFEELSRQADLTAASLRDMFSPAGDPRAADLFRVIGLLQQSQGIRLEVSTAA
ncbi:MAG: transcriptional regulator [Rhizobium sp.]|nr:transcriptional regulator [Rhizobium sp.]